MRSRFLNTDYFFSAQSQFETLKSFNIFPLSPPPPLSPPYPRLELGLPISDLESDLSSEIDRFPFATALSDFLSDVVPQFIPDEIGIEEGNLKNSRSEASENILDSPCGEEFRSDRPQIRTLEERKWAKKLQFEILELDFPLGELTISSAEDEAALCFEVPCIKIPMDTVDIEMEVAVTYSYEIVKSIYAVEVIPDCLLVKDDSSSREKIPEGTISVPEFEVSEMGPGLEGTQSIEGAFSALLPSLELQHGVHGDELVINAKEFLGSTNIDHLEHFSVKASSEQCLVDEPMSLNSVLDMDIMNLNGSLVLEENSTIHPLTPAGGCSSISCSVYFQEVQILDIPSVNMFEEISSSQADKGPDISDKMFKDDIDAAGSFYESVVSSELALTDNTFKSLPVPILSDGRDMKLQSRIYGDILHVLKPHASTATDALYLDWHPLLEGTCTREICSTYTCFLHEVTGCCIASELQSTDEDVFHISFDFLDDSLERLSMLECKEVLYELHGIIPQASYTSVKPAGTQVLINDANNIQIEMKMPKVNSEKVSSLFESTSQSNDLNFFLCARRGRARKSCSGETIKVGRSQVAPLAVFSKEQSQPSSLPEVYLVQWDIEVHHIGLSDHILCLIDNIQKSYLAILNYGTDIRSNTLLVPEDDFKFIGLRKEKLLDLITEKSKRQSNSSCRDETFMGLLALYAIKQLAFLLCFFGIHIAHLYISNLTRQIDGLIIRLKPLESLIEDACLKSERNLIESHPSLSLIETILKSETSRNGKTLIIADRLFWLPLKQKLTSLRIKPHEVRHVYKFANQLGTLSNSRFADYISEALLHSDCLLISHENVSDSFPFNKFSIILEYGGPSTSSKISSFTPKSHSPRVHFLKVSMGNHMHEALCEGFDVPHHLTLEGVSRSMPGLQGIMNKEHIENLLSFVPTEKSSRVSSESESHVGAYHETECYMSMSRSLNSNNVTASESSSADIVIVVNTQNFEKKMLISRRSSYQKVLTLEKDGVQIVEREVNLPLDLIFSAAVCLVWYEARNLGDDISSTPSIPMFMETIATNILMSLSFAFSGCILIFEGETSFLSAIMESSDTLYAAAATLDLNLQLFCSYTPESTDEIILSCIGSDRLLNRGIFPAMPESETLGESFLTRFPSINPLSAHAILSSGGMLIEFLEWSQKRRIQAVGKYHVPDEGILLFDILCRYGEMGESKSVMTECSSIDSDISSGKLQCGIKRQKFAVSSHNLDMPVDDFFHVEPLNQMKDIIQELPQASRPYQLKDFFPLQDKEKTNSSHLFATDEVLPKMRGTYTSMMSDLDSNNTVGYGRLKENFGNKVVDHNPKLLDKNYPSTLSNMNIFQEAEPRNVKENTSAGIIDHNSTFLDRMNGVLAKKRGAYTSRVSNLDGNNTVGCQHLKESFSDEVIDHNPKFLAENYPSMPRNINLFGEAEARSEPVFRNNLHDSRLAFDLSSHRTFPTSEEINFDTGSRTFVKDRTQSIEEKIFGRKFSCSSKNDLPMKCQSEYLRGISVPKCRSKLHGLLSKEKAPICVEKQHAKGIQSSRTQRGVQQKFEFLQSTKDKREVYQQTLTCNTCLSCPGSSRNVEKSYKRQDPSIIDSYRYTGGSQMQENIKKRRKGGRVRGDSINEERKESSFIIPSTWTPVDKRARQHLSFSRSGNEKQSKLVWRNRYSPGSSCTSRKRNRDAM